MFIPWWFPRRPPKLRFRAADATDTKRRLDTAFYCRLNNLYIRVMARLVKALVSPSYTFSFAPASLRHVVKPSEPGNHDC